MGMRLFSKSALLALSGMLLLHSAIASAQSSRQPPPPASPPSAVTPASTDLAAQAQAAFDPTGYWVAMVTRDWRYRMIVPGRGYYAGIPLTLEGKQFADRWDPAHDEAAGLECEAYGAPALMRVPTRLHITWQDANTLRVETDAGMQTRLLHFDRTQQSPAEPTRQGYSRAEWQLHVVQRGGIGPAEALAAPKDEPRHGSLKVVTSNLLPGLLRKNGVPYSANAALTEYWELNAGPDGNDWLTLTSVLHDPTNLRLDYYFNPIFQREPDGSKWAPSQCSLRTAP
jgi:hypothetical protein